MHERFSLLAAAREAPHAPAVVSASGVLTYGELAERVRRVIAWLEREPRAKSGVALVATLRIETLVAIYALLELAVPIVLVHPRTVASERRALVEGVGVDFMLDEAWTEEGLPERERGGKSEERGGKSEERGARSEERGARSGEGEEPLAIIFTSGTSGRSKGVELSRRAFAASADASAANLGWTPDDRWLLCMPIAHVGGLSVVTRCLAARRPVVLSPWTGSLDALLDDVARFGVTILSLVPTMLARIFADRPSYEFPAHVRVVLVGGDAALPSLLAEARRRGAPVLTTYGMSEACSQVATESPRDAAEGASAGVGRPLPGIEVRIDDGEIQVRGPTLMTRYLPEGRFADPFTSDGWFRTGDLGGLDAEGRLHVTGRRSDRIITGGENVDPREVELALLEVPGVSAACVFGVDDPRWGQVVAAAIIPADPASPPALPALADGVASRLASFKRPRAVALCESFAQNGTSKVDRRGTGRAVADRLVPLPRN